MNYLLYKIASKVNYFTIFLKENLRSKYELDCLRNPKNDFSGYYSFKISNYDIISPNEKMVPSLFNQIFKKEVYKFKTLKRNPSIIDCGSNIGLAIIYWKQIYPEAEIIAFEPSKKNFEALKVNIKQNSINDVQIINSAISSQVGLVKFTDNDAASGSLFLEKGLAKTYDVTTVRLDSYLQKNIDFLKIDIEGEEVNIIDQIECNLDKINNLFIEYHSFIKRPQRLSRFLDILEKANFRYYIEGEYSNKAPLCNNHVNLNQDLQVSIWAKKYEG